MRYRTSAAAILLAATPDPTKVGVGTTARRTMPLGDMARAPFLFWDGRRNSLRAQALGPLPDLTLSEATTCVFVNGPLLTHHEFHNTGVPPRLEMPLDQGAWPAPLPVSDEFNCRSRWSDARHRCAELDFMVTGAHTLDRACKVPSLRNVAERAPCMHAGQISTLADVIDHDGRAPAPARSPRPPPRCREAGAYSCCCPRETAAMAGAFAGGSARAPTSAKGNSWC